MATAAVAAGEDGGREATAMAMEVSREGDRSWCAVAPPAMDPSALHCTCVSGGGPDRSPLRSGAGAGGWLVMCHGPLASWVDIVVAMQSID